MKKAIVLLAGICLISCIRAQRFHSIPLGEPIPMANEKLLDISGSQVSIKDAGLAKGVLVMFSCNTCPYVIKNQLRTKALANFAKANQVGMILLNPNEGDREGGDSYQAMQVYAKEQGYDFYYAVDKNSKLANAFGATRTPEVYLFDAGGKLRYKGAIDDNPTNEAGVKRSHAKEAIIEMTSGKPITLQESRSLGCGIKRI